MKRILIVDVVKGATNMMLRYQHPKVCHMVFTYAEVTELPIPTDTEIKQMADEYVKDMIGVGGCDENMIQGNARKDYIAGANAIINLLK